jgi:nucleotide-binding universal stress UspA family protein
MYRSILVPLDGSTFGEHALPVALTIARRAGIEVRIAHVHVMPEFVASLGAPAADAALDEPVRESERAYLSGLAQRLAATWQVEVTTALLEGPPAAALCDYARATEAGLIVMSTHARGPLARFWLGSLADTLARHAPMPALLVRPPYHAVDLIDLRRERLLRRILVPLDGSALAEGAIEYAVQLGRCTDAEYTLLRAIDPLVMDYAPVVRLSGLDERLVERWRVEAAEYLEAVAGHLRVRSLHVHTKVVVAPPAAAIVDYARVHQIEVIAMATHARAGVARALLGSVTDSVVHCASAPVLLHHPVL